MFTFALLYVAFYITVLVVIVLYLHVYGFAGSASQLYLNQLWQTLSHYVETPFLIKFLIFQLTGLPPVFLFFLKFNFLMSVLELTSATLQLLIFLNLLLGVFFYVQFFSITSQALTNRFLKLQLKHKNTTVTAQANVIPQKYVLSKTIVFVLFISLVSFVFFFDFYIIVEQYLL